MLDEGVSTLDPLTVGSAERFWSREGTGSKGYFRNNSLAVVCRLGCKNVQMHFSGRNSRAW